MSEDKSKFLLCIETSHDKTNEYQFFKAILQKWNMERNFEICCIDGKDNLKNALPKLIQDHSKSATEECIKLVICFDMDKKSKEANIKCIKEQIFDYNNGPNTNNKIQKYKIFLLPKEEEGIFEDLLENIIPCKHKEFLKCCWNNFTKCIAEKKYKLPGQKDKMYSYIAAVKEDFYKNEKLGV